MMLKLGIIKKDGRVINHRSLLKVILNPVLRVFGRCIATYFDEFNRPHGLTLIKCKPKFNLWASYVDSMWYSRDYDQIIKRRRII